MKYLQKIGVFLVIFAFVFQSISVPITAMSNGEQIKVDDLQTATILLDENEGDIPLYEEDSETSEVLSPLQSDEEVVVLERLDDFSFVEYIQEDDKEEVLQGFLLNDSLNFNEDEILDDIQTATILTGEDEVDVPLYEEDSEDSEILTFLQSDDKVVVLESSDDFSFVEYTENDEEVWQGFILNNFLNFEKDEISEEEENSEQDEDLEKENLDESTESENEGDSITNEPEENSEEPEDLSKDEAANELGEDQSSDTEVEIDEEIISEDEIEKTDKDIEDAVTEKQQTFSVQSSTLQAQTYYGIALQNKTHVYASQSPSSTKLRSYEQGVTLKYRSLNANWYEATVKYNGKWTTGYIHKNDVENVKDSQPTLHGVAQQSPTKVYSRASTGASSLRTYAQGSILKYKKLTSDWYEATVMYKGKWTTGYIHKNHVENITDSQTTLHGVALQSPTIVYSRASTGSSSLRTYAQGSILKYKKLTSDWYEATVMYKGKWTAGYIHRTHVENSLDKQTALQGIGLQSRTTVYANASTDSKALKSYAQGTILKYRTFATNWYEATVYINGKKKTGYIHKGHVENITTNQETLKGWADKQPTNVYSIASKSSKVLKSYQKSSNLKFKTFTSEWYEATVYISGKPTTGYIHVDDVHFGFDLNHTNYDLSLDQALKIQIEATPQTDKKSYAWVSKGYIDSNNKVTAGNLNVRTGPGTNNTSLGTISNGTIVNILDEHNDWYAIEYTPDTQWVHAISDDVLYYLNPSNFINHEKQMFQFLDLSKPSGATESVLNKYLADKGTLANQGNAFIDAGRLNNVNDVYLISHAILETGNGKSDLANGIEVGKDRDNKTTMVTARNRGNLTKIKTVYNMFGIQAFDTCPITCGSQHAYDMGWTTPYDAIVGGAQFIGNEYIKSNTAQNTIYKMRWNPAAMASTGRYGKQYATDVGWAAKQINTMYDMYLELDSYILSLDIPVYK